MDNVLQVDSDFEDLEAPEDHEDGIGESLNPRWKKAITEVLVIPYRAIYSTAQSFKTPNRKCFVPGRPVFAKIIDVERTVSTHMLNPNLYVIQLNHGSYQWIVKRRYKHFQHLHQQLQLYRATLRIPFPTRIHRERRSSYKSSIAQSKDETGKKTGLPRFPKRPEALVPSDQIQSRKAILEQYLQALLKIRAFRNHHETLEFLEVSHLSFILGLGPKGKEGLVRKRTGTTHTRRCTFGLCNCVSNQCLRMQRCCGDCFGQWQKRWLIVKDTFVAYVRPKDGRLHCVMLVDSEFEVSSGLYGAGLPNGIIISNLSRQLVLQCWTKRRSKEWLDYIRSVCHNPVAKCFIEPNRFASYAPIRQGIDAHWFVDGGSYMSAIADALEAATEEIFISDWWLSPEIYMKRPAVEGEKWRLDKIIERKAKENVRIFVLLYKEVNLALGINSFYSKQKLVEKHPENIKVLRHPDHVSAGVFLWAHHEKLVIVDQSYAFVGGIDLCYGRWDDHNHRLTDLGSVSQTHQRSTGFMQSKMTSSRPGGGTFQPSSIMQLAKATNAVTIGTMVHHSATVSTQENGNEEEPPLNTFEENQAEAISEAVAVQFTDSDVPTEGIANGGETTVPASDDVHKKTDGPKENGDAATPLKGETPPMGRRNLIRKMTKVTRELKADGRDWMNKHVLKKDSKDEDLTDTDGESDKEKGKGEERGNEGNHLEMKATNSQKHKSATKTVSDPSVLGLQGLAKLWIGKDYTNFIVKDFADLESPFTDLVDRSTTPRMPWHDLGVMVHGHAARDVARHFIQRWNAVKSEKVPLNHAYPYLLPKSYDVASDLPSPILQDSTKASKVSCQVVRSMAQWSGGIRMIEDSIQQAYVVAIENAKHYVYIENQFFITLSAGNQQVSNRIGEALLLRILRAEREKTIFRVFVVIPLLPGFEGEVGTSRGIAIHAITHWNYSSICRGHNALMVRLMESGIEPTQYVTFHGLRTYSNLGDDLVTELIYVHSKLMIVDDNLVICGSANINDRSLTGKRDSEVCVVIEDETFSDSLMNGAAFQAGRFAQSLRIYLFREHLGLRDDDEIDLRDPIIEDFYRNVWIQRATKNTELYDEIFRCVPTDHCKSFRQMMDYQNEHPLAVTNPAAARHRLKEVKGHLVNLPLMFLIEENLLPSAGTKEGLMPTQLWT